MRSHLISTPPHQASRRGVRAKLRMSNSNEGRSRQPGSPGGPTVAGTPARPTSNAGGSLPRQGKRPVPRPRAAARSSDALVAADRAPRVVGRTTKHTL